MGWMGSGSGELYGFLPWGRPAQRAHGDYPPTAMLHVHTQVPSCSRSALDKPLPNADRGRYTMLVKWRLAARRLAKEGAAAEAIQAVDELRLKLTVLAEWRKERIFRVSGSCSAAGRMHVDVDSGWRGWL